jgi:hypothetical protein
MELREKNERRRQEEMSACGVGGKLREKKQFGCVF